jgi:hypothetical protein
MRRRPGQVWLVVHASGEQLQIAERLGCSESRGRASVNIKSSVPVKLLVAPCISYSPPMLVDFIRVHHHRCPSASDQRWTAPAPQIRVRSKNPSFLLSGLGWARRVNIPSISFGAPSCCTPSFFASCRTVPVCCSTSMLRQCPLLEPSLNPAKGSQSRAPAIAQNTSSPTI